MRAVLTSCFLLTALVQLAAQGFVTLEGRKFLLGGQEFYPRVMNYSFEFTSNTMSSTNPADIMVSPNGAYDKTIGSYFEHTDQAGFNTQMQQHFAKLAAMGFNTIRTTGLLPLMRWEYENGPRHYSIRVKHNIDYYTPDPTEYLADLSQPDFLDAMSERLFELTRLVLQYAEAAGLKVILLCADDTGYQLVGDIDQLTLATDQDAVDLYAIYLQRLGEELQNEPGLLAYDLWNEPVWTNYDLMTWTKNDVCGFSRQWYDAIHVHDNNHLITFGGASFDDLSAWDPAAMKIDFFSPHVYSFPSKAKGYDVQNSIDLAVAHLYWIGKDCPMPWLIGETGFTAEDDAQDPLDYFTGPWNQHLDNNALHHKMPWMMGTEQEQADFAQISMDATRNYLGSGYSWWGFQNSRGANLNSLPEEYLHNWWGPLKFGNEAGLSLPAPFNVEHQWRDKLVVDVFENHMLPVAPTALPAAPVNYYNWYEWSGPVVYDGNVEDQNGDPIADAIVVAGWRYFNPLGPTYHYEWDHITTDASGSFEIKEPPVIPGFTRTLMPGSLSAGATGANHEPLAPSGSTTTLFRSRLEYSSIVDGEVIINGDDRNYSAWNDLTVSNTSVGLGTGGGIADFVARQTVHVTQEFHAEAGSEVHIWNESTFPECVPASYRTAVTDPSLSNTMRPSNSRECDKLELRFQLPQLLVELHPIPCSRELIMETKQIGGYCSIWNANGALVHQFLSTSQTQVIDVSRLAQGEYILKVEFEGVTFQTPFSKLQ